MAKKCWPMRDYQSSVTKLAWKHNSSGEYVGLRSRIFLLAMLKFLSCSSTSFVFKVLAPMKNREKMFYLI